MWLALVSELIEVKKKITALEHEQKQFKYFSSIQIYLTEYSFKFSIIVTSKNILSLKSQFQPSQCMFEFFLVSSLMRCKKISFNNFHHFEVGQLNDEFFWEMG